MMLTVAACVLLAATSLSAQNVVREGNQFSTTRTARSSGEEKKTGYTWKDSKGNVYDIYESSRGSYYIWRVSSKTGKKYKSYLPKEVQEAIRNSK